MYHETPFDPREYSGSIADLITRPADARAAALIAGANANAEAMRQSGAAWGNAINNIGQTVAAIPANIQAAKVAQQNEQIRQQQLAELTQKGADLKALDAAYTAPGGRENVLNSLPGHLRPEAESHFADMDAKAESLRAAKLKADEATQDYVSSQAERIAKYKFDPQATQLVLSHAKTVFADDPNALNQISQIEQQVQSDPTPEGIAKVIGPLVPKQAPIKLADNEMLIDPTTLEVVAKGGMKKPGSVAELAYMAANGDEAAKRAIELAKPPKTGADTTAEQQAKYILIDQNKKQGKMISPEDQAYLDAYEDQKRIPTDATAAAAEKRQQATQAFQEMMAGKKELTEKVTLPYQQAQSAAQTLRDTVAAAKNGNKLAASEQSLETTLDLIRSAGLNRVNTAEIGATGNAGSLYDNIRGYVDKKLTGQPVPPDIQKDMLEFSTILEKAARKKYTEGYNSTVKSYSLKNEPSETGAEGTITVKAPDGTIHDFASQAEADRFKQLIAGAK